MIRKFCFSKYVVFIISSDHRARTQLDESIRDDGQEMDLGDVGDCLEDVGGSSVFRLIAR